MSTLVQWSMSGARLRKGIGRRSGWKQMYSRLEEFLVNWTTSQVGSQLRRKQKVRMLLFKGEHRSTNK